MGLAFMVGGALRASGQTTPVVPPGARVYRDLDRMAALGLIDTLVVGARPYSEREVTRLLGQARANLGRNEAARAWAEPAIAADLARYDRAGTRPVDELRAEAVFLDSPSRPAPVDSNGKIDAAINPLAAYRGGRPLARGGTFAVETAHSALLGKYLAAAVTPRVSLLVPRQGRTSASLRMQSGAVFATFGELALEVGRDYAVYGQSPAGGPLLSTSAPPLDMVRVWNDRPWHVPILSWLFGPIRGTAFLADLGDRQIHPRAKMVGYHITGVMSPHFEIGAEVLDVMGGRGGQPASFGDRVLDAIPPIDAFRTKTDFQFSNKLAGMDFRWRMPRWSGFEAYLDGDLDDVDGRRFRSSFLEDAGYVAGMSLSCLAQCGRLGVRAEYHQTGIRYYTHGDYPVAEHGQLLGDPLGPRGLGGYLTVDEDAGARGTFSVNAAFEVRSGNTYGSATTGPAQEGFHFIQLGRRPGEKRWRGVATWVGGDDAPISPSVSLGVERVSNFAFVAGAGRTNVLARVGLVARP